MAPSRPPCWLAWSLVLAVGCNDAGRPLPPPRPEAARRADEREQIARDFMQLGQLYKAYAVETSEPNTTGFWKYLAAREPARDICARVKEQRYAIDVPAKGVGIVAYETDGDLENTRVVVLADGTVNKAMPENKFQEATLKVRQ